MKNLWDLVDVKIVCPLCRSILTDDDIEITGDKNINVNHELGKLGEMTI